MALTTSQHRLLSPSSLLILRSRPTASVFIHFNVQLPSSPIFDFIVINDRFIRFFQFVQHSARARIRTTFQFKIKHHCTNIRSADHLPDQQLLFFFIISDQHYNGVDSVDFCNDLLLWLHRFTACTTNHNSISCLSTFRPSPLSFENSNSFARPVFTLKSRIRSSLAFNHECVYSFSAHFPFVHHFISFLNSSFIFSSSFSRSSATSSSSFATSSATDQCALCFLSTLSESHRLTRRSHLVD